MRRTLAFAALAGLAPAAHAHHAMDGKLPSTWFEGVMSGLAHPVIGLDHLAFVLAIGGAAALASASRRGLLAPAAFALAALGGTGLHLAAFDIPSAELAIAGSVVLVGAVLLIGRAHLAAVSALAALAGVVHGYAYGESIVGAEASPLLAYLLGFTAIQLAVALSSWAAAHRLIGALPEAAPRRAPLGLRLAGAAALSVGAAFLVGFGG